MMKGKWLNLGIIVVGALLLVLLGVGLSGAGVSAEQSGSEYVGSKACFGCHTDKYDGWKETGHAHMMQPVFKPADLPGNPAAAPAELQNELVKAQYVVAGQRFIARNMQTGQLSYLNVQYDKANDKYVSYKGGSSWEQGCAGCHSTGWVKDQAVFSEEGISCESCHGPGRQHILGRGDRSKIVRSTDAQVCGSCHNGGAQPDGTRWPDGWKPGMDLDDVQFTLTALPKDGSVPSASQHLRQMALIQASGHLEATSTPYTTHHDNPNCYTCHSSEARLAAEEGQPIQDLDRLRHLTDGVSCVACHDPHKTNGFVAQLRMAPEDICTSCHTASIPAGQSAQAGTAVHHPYKEMLAGYGAVGIDVTPSVHSQYDVTCVDCHMTEGNHMFKVILPETVQGTERKDSCVTCHDKSSGLVRDVYLDLWQNTTRNKVDFLKQNLVLAEAKVKSDPGLPPALVDKVKAVKTNLSFVEADKSVGAHNFDYVMKILTQAESDLGDFFTATR